MSTQHNRMPSPIPSVPVLSATVVEEPATSPLTLLRHEVNALRALQQHDFETFRAQMAAERAALQAAIAAVAPNEDDTTTHDGLTDTSLLLTSRRALLKWGSVGAAAALAAAGGAAITTPTAHAATLDNLILGSSSNIAEQQTNLIYDGSEIAPTAFQVTSTADNSIGISVSVGNVVTGSATSVSGDANDGVSAFAVAGFAGSNGTGVYGVATGDSAYGVWSQVGEGVAVQGVSNTGIDLAAAGSGRILLSPTTFAGAPTQGTYTRGEQIRDANGNLLLCIASGTPGTWVKAASVAPGAGGPVHLLSAPIRLLDTRTLSGKYPAGSTNILQITGVNIGGISVPEGATGVLGNVTVVSPTGSGDLRLYPGGAAAPGTSSINFAAGQVIANGVTVGLNTSGQISIKVDMPTNTATHVLFDASGYIM